jgi:Ca2+-dependent lipid-binding protein
LFTSADDLQSKLTPLAYEPCPGFITSDHKPVRGAFAIQTNAGTSSSTKNSPSRDKLTEPVSITFSNMKCTNLPSADIDGSSDPYIMFVCDPVDLVKDDRDPKDTKRTIQKQLGVGISSSKIRKWPCTSYKAKNLNPSWGDETVKLCIPPTHASHMHNGALLYVTVMDYDLSTQDDVLGTLPVNIAKLVSLPAGSDKEKTIEIDSPLLKYGEELGRIQCTIHVQRGGIEHYKGHRNAKFGGLCSCFGR